MEIKPEFAMQIGASILDAMQQVATIEIPDGYDVDDIKLTFEFNNPAIPAILHGEWTVAIKRIENNAT